MTKKLLPLVVLALGLSAAPSVFAGNGGHDECSCRDSRHRHRRVNCGPRNGVPELDANAAGGALALIVGGLLVVAGRRRKK